MDALITTNKDDFEKISRILIQLEIKRKKELSKNAYEILILKQNLTKHYSP